MEKEQKYNLICQSAIAIGSIIALYYTGWFAWWLPIGSSIVQAGWTLTW